MSPQHDAQSFVCDVLQRQHYPIKTILKPKIGQQTAYYVRQPN